MKNNVIFYFSEWGGVSVYTHKYSFMRKDMYAICCIPDGIFEVKETKQPKVREEMKKYAKRG